VSIDSSELESQKNFSSALSQVVQGEFNNQTSRYCHYVFQLLLFLKTLSVVRFIIIFNCELTCLKWNLFWFFNARMDNDETCLIKNVVRQTSIASLISLVISVDSILA
jgi:hypothetical protein